MPASCLKLNIKALIDQELNKNKIKMNNRHYIFFFVGLILISCDAKIEKNSEKKVHQNNKELKAMFEADQAQRLSPDTSLNEEQRFKLDEQRRKRVLELLDSNLINTSDDYEHAAMIFHHGWDTTSSTMAVKMQRKAIELDPNKNKWLLAAAIDRDLMRRNKPQAYGTQYVPGDTEGSWKLYKLDSTLVTDNERQEHGVPTLAQLKVEEIRMNQTKLAKLYSKGATVQEIVRIAKTSDLLYSDYNLSELSINQFGYQLMGRDKIQEALAIFKLNTELYPQGFNTFDSYGECLLKAGKTEEAILAYQKSLELNPKNSNAREVLNRISN